MIYDKCRGYLPWESSIKSTTQVAGRNKKKPSSYTIVITQLRDCHSRLVYNDEFISSIKMYITRIHTM